MAILIALFILLMGTTTMVMVQRWTAIESRSKTVNKSQLLATIGLERSKKELLKNTDWNTVTSPIFNEESYIGGTFTVTVTTASAHTITIESLGSYNDEIYKNTKNYNRNIDDSFWITFDTSLAEVYASDYKRITKISITNNHPTKNISMEEAQLLWESNLNETFERLHIDGAKYWQGSVPFGTYLDHNDFTLIPSQTAQLYFYFSSDMSNKNISFYAKLSDDSIAYIAFSPLTGSTHVPYQSEIFSLRPLNYLLPQPHILDNVTITNKSPTYSMTIEEIKININPVTSSHLIDYSYDGSSLFSGDLAMNVSFNITPTYFPTLDSKIQTFTITSPNNLQEVLVSSSYLFADGSITHNWFEVFKFRINTENAFLSSNKDQLKNIIFENPSNFTPIVISQIKVSWLPDSGEKLDAIDINSVGVEPGSNYPSGTLIDITDTSIPLNSFTHDLILDFDSEMSGLDITIEFVYSTGDTQNAYVLMNPSNYITSETFESNSDDGGSGWTSDWSFSKTGDFIKHSDQWSGQYALHMSGNDLDADRELDLTGESGVTIKFYAKALSFSGGDTIEFKISDDNKASWTTLKTWVNGDDDGIYYLYTFDLSGYTHGTNFYIAFDKQGNNNNLIIDDIFFY